MNKKLIKRFREKLKKEGRSIKWFVVNFIDDQPKTYTYFSFQINGWKDEINQNFIDAIKKYLGE